MSWAGSRKPPTTPNARRQERRRRAIRGRSASRCWCGPPSTAPGATAETAMKEGRESGGYLQTFLTRRSELHLQLGHQDEAVEDATRALKMWLAQTQPGTFSANLGRAYLALGRALQAQAKREEAREALKSAVEQMQSALGPDHAETQAARQLAELQI